MTREEFALKIKWPNIIWWVGVINPFIMVPQLLKMWTTLKADDVSVWMLLVILFVQVGFCIHGFFIRDKFLFRSNIAASIMTIITLISISIIRNI